MTEITKSAAAAANGRTVPYSNGKASYAEKNQVAAHFIGGNRLANAPPSKVKDFVAENDGHTVITNVSFAALLRPPKPTGAPFPPGFPQLALPQPRTEASLTTPPSELARRPGRRLFSAESCSLADQRCPQLGPHRQQRYCRRQGDPLRPKMGIRNIWR